MTEVGGERRLRGGGREEKLEIGRDDREARKVCWKRKWG